MIVKGLDLAKDHKIEYRVLTYENGKMKVVTRLGHPLVMERYPHLKFGVYRDTETKLCYIDEIQTGLGVFKCLGTPKVTVNEFRTDISENALMHESLLNTKVDVTVDERIANYEKFDKLYDEYTELTGKRIPLFLPYLIDIARYDNELQVPDNMSMADFLEEKYGKRVKDIVEELIKIIV